MCGISFKYIVRRDAGESTVYDWCKKSASKIGYKRVPILGVSGAPSDDPALRFRPTSSGMPNLEALSWPEIGRTPVIDELIMFRFARHDREELLSILVRMRIGERSRPTELEIAARVPELIQYSERQCDALLRFKFFLEELSEEGSLEALEGQRMTGVARRLLTNRANMRENPVPVEDSGKWKTRAFVDWASSLSGRGDLRLVVGPASLPVLAFKTRYGTQSFEVQRNLLNGSVLKQRGVNNGPEPWDFGLELEFLRTCWSTLDGLEGLEEVFGCPDATLGGFDPTGTGLSALEIVRDQWLYAGIVEKCCVVFREYGDGRLTVNALRRIR